MFVTVRGEITSVYVISYKNKLPVHIVTEKNTLYIYMLPHTNAPIFLFLAISPSRQTVLVDLFMSLGSILALRLSLR